MFRLRVTLRLLALAIVAAGCSGLPDSITIDLGNNNPSVDAIVQATLQAMTAAPPTAPGPASQKNPGSISGSLNYPADAIPAMYVVAFEVGTQNYKYALTVDGQQTFKVDGLEPGSYQVVAYTVGSQSFPAGLAGGYTQAVVCGLSEACTDHSLIAVSVASGQEVTGINPMDWDLVEGGFPAFPGQGQSLGAATTPAQVLTGTITGSLMFPASGIPALRIVAFWAEGGSYSFVDTVAGQSTYTIGDLQPGTYHVVAYVRQGGGFNSGQAGGYSQMVPCGLKYGCNDHSLIDVVVTPGEVSAGVDPNDYYADPGTFPANPAP